MPICKDCRQDFEITDGERQFFEEKTDENGQPYALPKRCKACRVKRKQENRQY